MKVHHQFARAFWDLHLSAALISDHNSTCKRLRPLVPQLSSSDATTVDLKALIRPDGGPTKKDTQPQAETTSHQGGTRWNPTQEQIGILETLYRGGIRTPNAQQIEHITTQLSKYGKIEGKNVFYWFQNHKARERQKHKRSLPNNSSSPAHAPSSVTLNFDKSKEDLGREGQIYNSCKRKCRTWTFESLLPGENIITEFTANGDDASDKSKEEDEDLGDKKTLKLFPLHPEGRSMMGLSII